VVEGLRLSDRKVAPAKSMRRAASKRKNMAQRRVRGSRRMPRVMRMMVLNM
jgi:hypothetical protein